MAEIKSVEKELMDSGKLADGFYTDGTVHRVRATIDLSSQPTGKITLCEVPKGALFIYGLLNSSVSLGTSTISIGDEYTADLIKAAGTFTSADTPVLFGKNKAVVEKFEGKTNLYMTVGTAALPAEGTLVVDMFFAVIH